MRGRWGRRVVRYLRATAVVAGIALLAGWPFLEGAGRNGLLVALAVAVPVQVVSFGLLAAATPGTPRYLAVWSGSTLARFGVVIAAALVVAGVEGVDLLVALLALVGLFFVLLLLEPMALREDEPGTTNGRANG